MFGYSPAKWVFFSIFFLFDHFLSANGGMAMWGGTSQNDAQKLYENMKNNENYFNSCTRIEGSEQIHYIVDQSNCAGKKCCDFRDKLTQGVGPQMNWLVNSHLLRIRDEINNELRWDVHSNEAYVRKNAMALIMVQQMVIDLMGGEYSNDGRVMELKGKMEGLKMSSLNQYFNSGILRVHQNVKAHFTSTFGPIKPPAPVVPQEMFQNGVGSGNSMMGRMGGMGNMMAENRIQEMANKMNNSNPSMMPMVDLFKKYQEIFNKINRNISQLFLVLKNAFEEFDKEKGCKGGTMMKDFLRHFEQILRLKKPSKDPFARFHQIFSQNGYKSFTNKTVYDQISQFFAATETRLGQSNLLAEWLGMVEMYSNDQSMAQQSPQFQPQLFNKFVRNFQKFSSVQSDSPQLFYLMKTALDNLSADFIFGPSNVPIDKFFKFALKNVPGENLKKNKGKRRKRAKPRLQQFSEIFEPFQIFPSKQVYSLILAFFDQNKGPSVIVDTSLMEKFLGEIEKLEREEGMKIEAFAKFMQIVGKYRGANGPRMDEFFDHFHDAIIEAKGGTPSTNCDKTTVDFVESFGPPAILPPGTSLTKDDCKKGFEQRYKDQEEFFTILAFQKLLASAYPATISTPPNFDEFDRFIENFGKKKSSVKNNADISKRMQNLFESFLKLDAKNAKFLEMYDIVAGATQRMEEELLKNGKTKAGKSAYMLLFEDKWRIKPLAMSSDKKTELFAIKISRDFKNNIANFTKDLKQFFDTLDGTDGSGLLKKFLSAAERIQVDFKNSGSNLRGLFKEKICDKYGCNSGKSAPKNSINPIRKTFKKAFQSVANEVTKFNKGFKMGNMMETFMKYFGKATVDDSTFKQVLDDKIHNLTEDESFHAFLEFFLNFKDDNGAYLDGKGSIVFKAFLKFLK